MFKILPSCECTCGVHECQGFSPELLIVAGRLPLMDAGSESALEVTAQSQQGPELSEGNWSCWFSPKAVSSHLMLCVLTALFSAFLFPESSSLQVLPAVPRVRWALEQGQLLLFPLCARVTARGARGQPGVLAWPGAAAALQGLSGHAATSAGPGRTRGSSTPSLPQACRWESSWIPPL